MKKYSKTLDKILEQIEDLASAKSGLDKGIRHPTKVDGTTDYYHYGLLLNLVHQLRVQLLNNEITGRMGISRFASEWSFEEKIEDLCYEADNYAQKYFSENGTKK